MLNTAPLFYDDDSSYSSYYYYWFNPEAFSLSFFFLSGISGFLPPPKNDLLLVVNMCLHEAMALTYFLFMLYCPLYVLCSSGLLII